MRIFAFKTTDFVEIIPAMTYIKSYKSLTIGWLKWFVEFTTDRVYGDSRAKESYIKVIK